jgi:hypothetical protein
MKKQVSPLRFGRLAKIVICEGSGGGKAAVGSFWERSTTSRSSKLAPSTPRFHPDRSEAQRAQWRDLLSGGQHDFESWLRPLLYMPLLYKRTAKAGPSTTLRSGRDDKALFVKEVAAVRNAEILRLRGIIRKRMFPLRSG